MRYTTILWDVDNTLLDFEYSMRLSLKRCFEILGRGDMLTEEMIDIYTQINDMYWKRLERGEVTKAELLIGRFVDWFKQIGIDDIDPEHFRGLYQISLGEVYAYMEEDALPICKDLAGKVKQYVVTNGVAATQRNKLMLSGFSEVMDGIFISEELGANKPDAKFFEACFDRIAETDLSKVILVGDSLTSDMKGANNANISCCWYNPGAEICPDEIHVDYEIRSLKEIYGVLGSEK